MGKFSKISTNAFKEIQFDAGMVLSKFDLTGDAEIADEDIICATSGGIQVSLTPSYTDYGEDIDNVPTNMMELKEIESWEAKMSFTCLSVSLKAIKAAIGAADITDTKVTPRASLKTSDFADIYWVGDMKDGGWACCKLMNALGTGGFSLQTTKKGKGQVSVELTGHVSINAQDVVPMEFYVKKAVGK